MRDTYNGGYFKALFDVRTFFESHSQSLKFSRLYNQKGVMQVLDALIENREELRETGDVANLIYNTERKEFVYDREGKRR
nr:MAG TPA: hypothetical protein [Caudoviricetes sp.]